VAARPTDSGPPESASPGAASVLLPALQPPATRHGTVVRRALLDRFADDTSQGFLAGLLTEVAGLTDPAHTRAGRSDGLSAREAEVLSLVAGGRTNGEIAAELVLRTRALISPV
jgi:DNA-binding NarL/FixJ family response regulator